VPFFSGLVVLLLRFPKITAALAALILPLLLFVYYLTQAR
jgi:hypothetical protein